MAYNSTISSFKIGNCSCGCNGINVQGRKVGKIFYCTASYSRMKTLQQVAKQNLKLSIRKVGRTQDKELQNKVVAQTGLSYLIADLDTVVSRYLRIKEATVHGICQCYTCQTNQHWTLMQASHFISRTHLATRWLLDNLKVGCYNCNVNLHGNLEVYADNLEKEKFGTVEYLQNLAREVSKPTQTELKELLIDFKSKLKLVELKLKK